jgi:hypothetical protein
MVVLGPWGAIQPLGPFSIGPMLKGGAMSVLWNIARGEDDFGDLARAFAVGALQAGVYDSGVWRKYPPAGLIVSDFFESFAVSAIWPSRRGFQLGFGIASYNLGSGDVKWNWGRMLHLGLSYTNELQARPRDFYDGWSWQRVNKYGNLSLFSLHVDEMIVTKIQYHVERLALEANQGNNRPDGSQLKLEVYAVAAYASLRLLGSVAVLQLWPTIHDIGGGVASAARAGWEWLEMTDPFLFGAHGAQLIGYGMESLL